jgi:L-seryl-tRNA(Ser) seleniumtransferase
MPSFRQIPSIEQLLQRPSLKRAAAVYGREEAATAARAVAQQLRESLATGGDAPASAEEISEWMECRVGELLADRIAPSLRRVINATGVILHTNLGRAPLAAEARTRAAAISAGYSNLEYDLTSGSRGHRHVHAERLLCALTGAQAAAVVNNNAGATLLALAALASGREVIVSRGELVEIGGGFRVPDVMAQSGATLREVGTTNRTRVADYAAAVTDRTALILRVHPSNFRVEGFTERPTLTDLSGLAHRFHLPLFEDLGSGWLGLAEAGPAVGDEPPVERSIRDGADIVAFSGDKLLGGPQAGLMVGRRDLIDIVRRHPLMRALRADKLTYAALEATLGLWSQPPARVQIPVYRMLTLSVDDIDRRAKALIDQLREVGSVFHCAIVEGTSTIGGGSAPGSALPTKLIALDISGLSASALEARLRMGDPPVVARIQDDRTVIDLRTVAEEEDNDLVSALRAVLNEQLNLRT